MGDAADDAIRKADQEIEEEGYFVTDKSQIEKLPEKPAIRYYYETGETVLVVGNVWEDGLQIIGPFGDGELALRWMNEMGDNRKIEAVVSLQRPGREEIMVPYNPDLE